jgi:hypothetical protein
MQGPAEAEWRLREKIRGLQPIALLSKHPSAASDTLVSVEARQALGASFLIQPRLLTSPPHCHVLVCDNSTHNPATSTAAQHTSQP